MVMKNGKKSLCQHFEEMRKRESHNNANNALRTEAQQYVQRNRKKNANKKIEHTTECRNSQVTRQRM